MNFSRFRVPLRTEVDVETQQAIEEEKADQWHDQAVDRELEREQSNMISLYPDSPGSKVVGPSADAAKTVASDAAVLRWRCLVALRQKDMTADECADLLNTSLLSIRPRFSELKAKGEIFDSGVRRKNASGHSATVWTVRRPE